LHESRLRSFNSGFAVARRNGAFEAFTRRSSQRDSSGHRSRRPHTLTKMYMNKHIQPHNPPTALGNLEEASLRPRVRPFLVAEPTLNAKSCLLARIRPRSFHGLYRPEPTPVPALPRKVMLLRVRWSKSARFVWMTDRTPTKTMSR
jgi:hypothetical protein